SAGHSSATGAVPAATVRVAELVSADNRQQLQVPLKHPIVLPGLLPLRVMLGGRPRSGSRYSLNLFDPMTLADRPVEIKVTAESTMVVPDSADSDSLAKHWFPVRWDTLHAWRIEQRSSAGTLEAWIDDQGRMVSASFPG